MAHTIIAVINIEGQIGLIISSNIHNSVIWIYSFCVLRSRVECVYQTYISRGVRRAIYGVSLAKYYSILFSFRIYIVAGKLLPRCISALFSLGTIYSILAWLFIATKLIPQIGIYLSVSAMHCYGCMCDSRQGIAIEK
jgi:hypothetical protein